MELVTGNMMVMMEQHKCTVSSSVKVPEEYMDLLGHSSRDMMGKEESC